MAGPPFTFQKQKQSQNPDLNFPGEGQSSYSVNKSCLSYFPLKVRNPNSTNDPCYIFDQMTLCTIKSKEITIDCHQLEPERFVFNI